MSRTIDIFISSKMVELGPERKALETLLPTLGDDTTEVHPWIFESDAPASGSSIREVYLKALDDSELYIGLFWNDYGEWTIDEFHRAGEQGITRHIYVKNFEAEQRDPRLEDFLSKQGDVRFGITPRWFTDVDDLKAQVARSVQQWLLERQIAHHSVTTAVIATMADDVPELPRRLIGRDDLIDEVNDLLDDNERVLMRGFGGMGKTALAATIVADRIDDGRGDVVWVKAGAADADAIFEALGRAFGAQQVIARTTGDERIQAVRHLLAEHKALPVLDDVWDGNALAQVLKAIPRRMPLLVTSRQRFPLDVIIEVGELRPKEALKLLSYHARRRDLDDDPDALHLCEVLGNHAFALEVAGKTLKVYDLLPAALTQRIEDAPHDLNMPGDFGELGRKGIKALLDASIDALDKDLLDLFMTLGGLFEPTATPELAALTMQAETLVIDRALKELELRGLVNGRSQAEVDYYRLHDLAYSYARAMFISRGLSQQPVIDACHTYTTNHTDDLAALDVEQSNILEAAEAAHQAGRDAILVDMMRLLTVDGPFFAARGHTSLSLQLLKTAIDAALDGEQPETAHYLLSKLGNTYADFTGDLETALDSYQKALELARMMADSRREAILLTVIGTVRFRQGADDADNYHQQAEQIARSNSDDFALCQVLHNRGAQALLDKQHPDYDRGRQLSDEAASLAARHGLSHLQFHSLVNRGGCEYELGQVEQALKTHQEAFDLAQAQGNHPWKAYALRSIGEDYHALDNRSEAQRAFDEALTLWRQSGGKAQIADLTDFMEARDYMIKSE